MNLSIPLAATLDAKPTAREEAVSLLLGVGFTFALFLALARFENSGTPVPVAEIEDLRMATTLLEPPPPPPKLDELLPPPEEVAPLSGLELGASDSPVSIAVVPPDLESLVPAATTPPKASVPFGILHAELKPKGDVGFDVRHIYQTAEVDQRPVALVRTVPPIPPDVRGGAATLRVELVLLIGRDGRPESARVVESSGNPRFDAIVARTVQNEWMFSPAIRRGAKVRVLAQQAFRINFTAGGSPFGLE